jgi:hypothetical protein
MKPEFWWRKEWGVPPAKEDCSVNTRLDIGTFTYVKREALANGRSMSGQIWFMLAKVAKEDTPDPYRGIWEAHDGDDVRVPVRECTHWKGDRQVQTRSRVQGPPIKWPYRTHCTRCGATGSWASTVEGAYNNL